MTVLVKDKIDVSSKVAKQLPMTVDESSSERILNTISPVFNIDRSWYASVNRSNLTINTLCSRLVNNTRCIKGCSAEI